MTKRSHNKKRNVGIIYEQLIFTVSKGLINDNLKQANAAKKLIKKYFKPGTELHKEHKLMLALIKPQIISSSLATNILQEARNASKIHNIERLSREKSRLIRDINLTFGKTFYNQKVKDYKKFATVQTLINDWRNPYNKDFERTTIYEAKVHDILLENKQLDSLESQKNTEINKLVVDIMTKKFNQKYGKRLNEMQQNLIKQYVFSGKEKSFETTLNSLKESTLRDLTKYTVLCESKIVQAKIDPVIKELRDLDTSNIDDNSLSKFMLLCQLKEELAEKTNG
tara:strand:- start:409 stop:1254 length:846 start_codon:yes stop_codon:yes gene_type:complete